MKKSIHRHIDRRVDAQRAAEYPILLAACRARGLRTLEDFSPAELAQMRARLASRLAVAYVSSTSEEDGCLSS